MMPRSDPSQKFYNTINQIELAAALGVDTVLEGSVRRSGDTIRKPAFCGCTSVLR